LPPDELEARLRGTEAAVVMKLGRTFEKVRDAARRAAVAARGIYVERASTDRERLEPLEEVEGEVPYMSLVLVASAEPASSEPAPWGGLGCGRPARGRARRAGARPARARLARPCPGRRGPVRDRAGQRRWAGSRRTRLADARGAPRAGRGGGADRLREVPGT